MLLRRCVATAGTLVMRTTPSISRGCHHMWDLHCTVEWRYGIAAGAHDGCIGFRVVLAPGGSV